jgi:hypothetical protein
LTQEEFNTIAKKINEYKLLEGQIEKTRKAIIHSEFYQKQLGESSIIIKSHFGNGSSDTDCSIESDSPYFTEIQQLLNKQVKWLENKQAIL